MNRTKDPFWRLVKLVEHLRSPKGCPWDREQTNKSLGYALIEESREIQEAIKSGDVESFKEELGDLLYVILFHIQIAREHGLFDIEDLLSSTYKKMFRRHNHVFGKKKANNSEEAYRRWQEIKHKEKSLVKKPKNQNRTKTLR